MLISFDATFVAIICLSIIFFYLLSKLEKRVKALELCNEQDVLANSILFFTTINGKKERVTNMFLKVSQQLPLSVEIKDKFANPAKVDGAPAWAVSDASLGVLEVAADGMSAVFKPAGPLGVCKVQVSADADLGEGVKSILGELEVELLAGEAVSVNISAGQPV